jgi:cystathionine beta-lyase
MNSPFDNITPRRGTSCVKWDECGDPEVIPMWVADMDFPTAPCVVDALRRRVDHGVFGYSIVPESFYQAIIRWQQRRHGWHVDRSWIQYTTGVVPALSAIIKALTKPGDGVLVQTPVYNCFFSSIRNNGCRIVEAPLTWHPREERYDVDFEALEQTIVNEHVRLFLLCSPHNPAGHVWTADELRRLAEVCRRHGVIMVADEIHGEFVNPALGRPFQPFGPIADEVGVEWVVAGAPSKAFNTAGLQIAYIVSPNADFRQRIDRAINDNEVCDVNPFGIVALEAAYSADGEAWLDSLVDYIYENDRTFRRLMKSHLPQLPVARLDGTYLAWVDVSSITMDTERLCACLRADEKVWVNPGEMYGCQGFLRVNLAAPRQLVEEGTRRLIRGLNEKK